MQTTVDEESYKGSFAKRYEASENELNAIKKLMLDHPKSLPCNLYRYWVNDRKEALEHLDAGNINKCYLITTFIEQYIVGKVSKDDHLTQQYLRKLT